LAKISFDRKGAGDQDRQGRSIVLAPPEQCQCNANASCLSTLPINMLKSDRWDKLSGSLLGLGLGLGAALVLLPLVMVMAASVAAPGGGLTLAHYQVVWARGGFWLAFANSTLVALTVTACQLITSALAGYALARLQFRGRQALLLIILTTLVIPLQLLVVPIFLLLQWGHLINTYSALILPSAANGFGIFLLRQYFQAQPVELEEAATLDGADRLQVLTLVMLPLARPALVTLFLFAFMGEWNDLFKPLVLTTRPQLRTVQLALASLQAQLAWGPLMAAVVMATLPVLVLFLLGQRQLMRGITATGIKG
jgi:multiple sugar transport system permease protein